jgi:hypothetical protein
MNVVQTERQRLIILPGVVVVPARSTDWLDTSFSLHATGAQPAKVHPW